MLLQIMLIRLLPFVLLRSTKERKKLKILCVLFTVFCSVLFLTAVWGLVKRDGIIGFYYAFMALVPHAFFYVFACWLLFRCLWKEWSLRVWKRIYMISFACVFLGCLMENYCGKWILKIFCRVC